MSFTEECEIWLRRRGINTEGLSNEEIRQLFDELFEEV